jgi:hypothetical protein
MKKILFILMAYLTIYSCTQPDINECIYDDGVANIPPNVRDYFDEFTVGKRWVMANRDSSLVDTLTVVDIKKNNLKVETCETENVEIFFQPNIIESLRFFVIGGSTFNLQSYISLYNDSTIITNFCKNVDVENSCFTTSNTFDISINGFNFKKCLLYESYENSNNFKASISSNLGVAFIILGSDTIFTKKIF